MTWPRRALVFLFALCAVAAPAAAIDFWDGRAQIHGFGEIQVRGLADNFEPGHAYTSQWTHLLNLEGELDLAPNGAGPFELVQLFTRVEIRYECVWTGCGIATTHRDFGDRAQHAPASNWTDGRGSGFRGDRPGFEARKIHKDTELLTIASIPLLEPLIEAGATNVEETLGPTAGDLFAYRKLNGSRDTLFLPQGPWRPKQNILSNGALRSVPNPTLPLPLRPEVPAPFTVPMDQAQGLFVPSAALRQRLGSFDGFDQNFTQTELEWNHGGGQDEHELKELYLDLELFEGRLWLRLGKQTIAWGKTELFRNVDQWNPQDIGLSSLPSLEESRLSQWMARGVWSFYDVGPLEDVRLEVAANFDDFEPTDIGRCGEPYTVWLLCFKNAGLWGHGVFGAGLAGEVRPEDPWNSVSGVEVGARVEWRWDRFSFALSDFWGYDDAPVVENFFEYERAVDPFTGRPLASTGAPLTPENALDFSPANRQIFDFLCSVTLGIAGELDLSDGCLLDLVNAQTPLFPGVTPPVAIGTILAGTSQGEGLIPLLTGGTAADLVELDRDPATDGDGTGFFSMGPTDFTLAGRLTDPQEALLGCGAFYADTDCDTQGIDFFNSEASVLIQSFPLVDPGTPVATRFVPGVGLVQLPGARGPLLPDGSPNPAYDPAVDGVPPPGFDSEMAALSFNFAQFLAALEIGGGNNPECTFDTLEDCTFLQAVLAITGVRRPEQRAGGNGRFGRRDFLWHGAGEGVLRYGKRNTLGLSADFAEDWSKTNWSLETSWIHDAVVASNRESSLTQQADLYNFTVSVDRPTFVNFLNANRSFFLNAQLFVRWIPDHDSSYAVDGPVTALATFTAATGYFQDRLLPAVTFVHDFKSRSGALITQVTYRYNQDFSATFGVAVFHGSPDQQRIPFDPIGFTNAGGKYEDRLRYSGLSAIAERDELFLRLRYTF